MNTDSQFAGMALWALWIVGAYLLGSISFSMWIARAVGGIDIRATGSGNAGATNVLRSVGKGPALAVLALDIAKGAVPVLAARSVGAPGPVIGAAAVAAVVGHIFPIYYGFRGGKGVATAVGAMSTLALLPALVSALLFFVVVATTRYVGLGSMVAVSSFPLAIFGFDRLGWTPPAPLWLLVSAMAVALLIVFMHRANIGRLLAGNENKLGAKRREGS